MTSFGDRLARIVVCLSMFMQDGQRWLWSRPIAVRPWTILIGLVLALHLSSVTFPEKEPDGLPLLYSKSMVIGEEDANRIWTDESTKKSKAGKVYFADLERPKPDGFYCPCSWRIGKPWSLKACPHSSASLWSERHVLLERYVILAAVGEQSPGGDISNEDSWSPWRPGFYVFVACAVSANMLYFVRKIIVVAYGYKKIRYPGFDYDRRSLNEIARSQASGRRRQLFKILNTLISVLVISAFISFFLLAVIELLRAGFGRLVFQIVKEQMDKIVR